MSGRRPYTSAQREAAFWRRVRPRSGDRCWIWRGGRSATAYGNVWWSQRNQRAHRVSWELAHGRPAPADLGVLHSCDEPLCVNPAHLFLGTAGDNVADMHAKGRGAKGYRRPQRAVPTDVKAGAIARIRAGEATGVSVAIELGVARTTVSGWLNPERERRNRERTIDLCRCGRRKNRVSSRCGTCRRRETRAKRARIARMWNAGVAIDEIAAAVPTTVGTVRRELDRARDEGVTVAYRYDAVARRHAA